MKLAHPDDRARIESSIAEAIANDDETYQIDYRVLNQDGNYIGVTEVGWIERDDAEQPSRVLCRIVQSTPTQSPAAGKPERTFRSFADHYPDFISRLDRDLKHIYINPAFERALGLSAADFIGKRAGELSLPPGVPQIYEEKATAVLASRQEERFEFCITTEESGTRHYQTRLIPELDENGEIESILSVTYEITAHKLAEDKWRVSDERLRMALEAAEVGTWEWDAQRDQVTLHGQARKLFGLSEDFEGSSEEFLAVIHSEDRAAVDLAVRRSMDTGAEFRVDFRIACSPNDDVKWLMAKGQPYKDASGAPDRLLGIVYDITPRKQIEVARQQMLEREQAARVEAEAAAQARDEFLAIISHELRTPLSAVLGWAQLLRTRQPGDGVYERAMDTIERNAKRQNQLIEDLLDTSRIISGKLRIDVQPLYVAPLVEEAMEVARPAASARAITLEMHFDSTQIVIMGDQNRLQQVLWNLLSNAIKFTPPGGRVDVYVSQEGSDAKIVVKDTGKGISPKFLQYVFDPFRQEDSSSARRQGGLGLGLALSRRLVEMHGGTIEAQSSDEDQGAAFTVWLPAQTTGRTTAKMNLGEMQRAIEAVNMPNLGGALILVVDDDADVRDLLSIRLEQYGASVKKAESVAAALAFIENEDTRPDVIVSDIAMPVEDGFGLIERVRALPADSGGRIPAIALTAYSRVKDRLEALAAGFQMHLAKPVDASELAVEIASILERSRNRP
jgi:PAS domain S-box-containing protein